MCSVTTLLFLTRLAVDGPKWTHSVTQLNGHEPVGPWTEQVFSPLGPGGCFCFHIKMNAQRCLSASPRTGGGRQQVFPVPTPGHFLQGPQSAPLQSESCLKSLPLCRHWAPSLFPISFELSSKAGDLGLQLAPRAGSAIPLPPSTPSALRTEDSPEVPGNQLS